MPIKPPVPHVADVWIRSHIVANSHPFNLHMAAFLNPFGQSDLDTLAGAFGTSWAAQAGSFNADMFFDFVEVIAANGSGLSSARPLGVQGSRTGVAVDYAQCKEVLARAVGAPPHVFGRLYVPGQVVDDYSSTDKSEWIASVNTSAIHLFNQFTDIITSTGTWVACVKSEAHATGYPYSGHPAYCVDLKINHITGRDSK